MTKKEEREAKKLEKLRQEKERMHEMFAYERKYGQYNYICGVDEVGRGPFAGPVVAGAGILPEDCDILFVDDFKKNSEKERGILYDEIYEKAVAVGIGMASEKVIDEINILQATYKAMQSAIEKLEVVPDLLLNDAVTIPEISIPQVPIIKGDAKSASIAAASIVAKVTRDRMMKEYDAVYPGYQFARNKGYGTKAHIEAIRAQGICEIHRRTFVKKYI